MPLPRQACYHLSRNSDILHPYAHVWYCYGIPITGHSWPPLGCGGEEMQEMWDFLKFLDDKTTYCPGRGWVMIVQAHDKTTRSR